MTTLMQAHRQWSSRAPDQRFASLIEMQSFKRRVREQMFQLEKAGHSGNIARWPKSSPKEWRQSNAFTL